MGYMSTHTGAQVDAAVDAVATKQAAIKLGTISLGTTWTGTESPYYQVVAVTGVNTTANSKVDLQPSATVINQMSADKCKALYVANESGTLKCYAVGNKLTATAQIQVSVTEVN